MLVAHDGPEYAEHSALLRLLPQLPPLRATLIGPVDRNEIYSASARYARALADEILPSLPPAPVRIGLGASLGALALFHAHRRYPESFDALFLQSGSFFRRAESYERWFPRYERIARFVGGVHRNRPERTIPLVLACGTVEENLAANRALAESLAARGYDVAPARVPRRAQLGRVARLLPAPPARVAREDRTLNGTPPLALVAGDRRERERRRLRPLGPAAARLPLAARPGRGSTRSAG